VCVPLTGFLIRLCYKATIVLHRLMTSGVHDSQI
jgi:hypothetical protein